MKRFIIMLVMSLMTIAIYAKDAQTLVVTTTPKMSCQNCEKKIKTNIRFVKGTKTIETDLKQQHVTITFDPEKAKVEDYVKAFEKIGYKIQVIEDQKAEKTNKSAK